MIGMTGALDPRLAARLNELGPVVVPRVERKTPAKVNYCERWIMEA
jgi:hypothetical protein